MSAKIDEPVNPAGAAGSRAIYLLLEKNPVIAADMIGALNSGEPCYVVHLEDKSEIVPALVQMPGVTAAIMDLTPRELQQSEIENALKHLGAKIVLTQGESERAEAESRGWKMLLRPFTDLMLWDVLKGRPAQPTAS